MGRNTNRKKILLKIILFYPFILMVITFLKAVAESLVSLGSIWMDNIENKVSLNIQDVVFQHIKLFNPVTFKTGFLSFQAAVNSFCNCLCLRTVL